MKFFRPDLKLDDKWWHRLVKVLRILSIIALIFGLYSCFMYFGYTYNYVEELKYRLGDE
jgi:hypothetical protein